MTTFVTRDGSRLTPYMNYQLDRLNFDLKRLFGVEIRVTSGIRIPQEQIDIFLQRYVTAGNIRGRKVYDTRVWRGVRYYRISSAGTVAVPGTSNHEIQGDTAAVDLRDTGSDGGVATWGSARANWLRANAWRYDMEPEGYNFNEAWHYKVRNIYNAVPGSPAGGNNTPKEGGMTQSVRVNKQHLYTIDDEFLSHSGSIEQNDISRQVFSATDERHDLSSTQFFDLLDACGIPRGVVDLKSGAVLNPESGKHEGNGVWSRKREAVALEKANAAKLDALTKAQAADAAKLDALTKAIAALTASAAPKQS